MLLMILDGWGIGKNDKSNAIYTAGSPKLDALASRFAHAQLRTDGENVGLPNGQMGNSEVGHLNIGAGRIVYQDLVKINIACRTNSIMDNPEVKDAYSYVKQSGKQLHLMGLVSDGGVHSSLDHLLKLCDIAQAYGIDRCFIHCFMDGRDTDPKSGKGYLEQLQNHLNRSTGMIASVVGRYYAMDRDKRWERVKLAYDLLAHGTGAPATNPIGAVQQSYNEGVTDEFIKPIVRVDGSGKPVATLQPNDTVIFFNFRNDRARQLTYVLSQQDLPEQDMKTIPLRFYCMTPYDASFKGLRILFDKDNVSNTLGEVVAAAGKRQLRIAETEKYAHVTFFFSGGREAVFPNEDRILVPSPRVATYDLKPEMSAYELKDKLAEALHSQSYNLIVLNFANGDMVGHTGVYAAIEKAVSAVDSCAGELVALAEENGYTTIIIADHGNADNALNADGSPNTAHSLNPVPIIVVDKDVHSVASGILADLAPTVLKLMGIPAPKEMTGKVLI